MQGRVERVEMIDEGLARVPVVDEQSVEPFLLQDDAILDDRRADVVAGRVAPVAAAATMP